FGPDEDAKPVAPVEKARVLHLLMDSQSIEAELLHQLDLLPQGVSRWCGKERVRPVVLRKNQAQKRGNSVQNVAPALNFDPAQSKVAVDAVHNRIILVDELDRGFDEVWMFRGPLQLAAPGARQIDAELQAAAMFAAFDRAEIVHQRSGRRVANKLNPK